MDEKTYQQFFDALEKIVNEHGPYKDKLNSLRDQMTADDETNFEELMSWFDN